jgi:hypothetical protein
MIFIQFLLYNIRYGIQISQLRKETKEQHLENLINLIKTTKAILKQNKVPQTKLSKNFYLR